ncbi:MAG: FCD domain-containing protein, partial [Pseudonocardia sp.]|nr:FCD domain-containing protein [Pseudonocardia sp.]
PAGLVESLDEIGEQMRASAERAQVDALARQNLSFHRALREAAANTYLDRFLGQVEHAVRRLPVSTFAAPGRAAEAIAEHDAIVRAIEAREPDRAERAATEHMRKAREIRLSVLLGS